MPEFSAADTAWMMIATALVMVMTPAGLALFYGGMTQRKSVLNTVGMSYTAYCVATLTWVVIAYTLAFGEGGGVLIGGLKNFMLWDIPPDALTGTIPTLLFVAFQGTFAAISVAIVSGSIVERVRYSTWLVFCVLWVTLCYAPIAHAVWGGGLATGHLDFAGGTVVHINAGVSGLVVAMLLGRRKIAPDDEIPAVSIKLTMLGSALLWFGWFGFNAGSALASNAQAANAILVTNVAAAAGGVAWLLLDWGGGSRQSLIGTASGVVSGLVGITPAAGYVDVSGAILIGLLSGVTGYFAVQRVKVWLGYDDTLDAFGIHGVVGVVGSLMTVLLAREAIGGTDGAFFGNFSHLLPQIAVVLGTIVFSALMAAACFWLSSLITGGGRISEEHEKQGADAPKPR